MCVCMLQRCVGREGANATVNFPILISPMWRLAAGAAAAVVLNCWISRLMEICTDLHKSVIK